MRQLSYMLANLVYYTTTMLHLGGLQIWTVANALAYNTFGSNNYENITENAKIKILFSECLYYKCGSKLVCLSPSVTSTLV
jgi:hypothetical protein